MARKTATIKKNQKRAVIIGAGITEKWYFSHMQTLYGLKVKIRPRYFGNENVNTLEKLIKQVLDNEGFVIGELKKFIPNFDKSESFLSNKKWVDDMCKDGKLNEAYARAKQLGIEGESYTNLWKAFDYLGIFSN